jgi:hypothetical protein
MKLYAGTMEQFRADARMHRIAEKLRAEYTTQIGHRPAPSEVASWQNSLMALSMLLDHAELNDHGVILEYQLGNTSRRLDAMLTGHSPTSAENAVVVEPKQWSDGSIGPSTADKTSAPSRASPQCGTEVELGCTQVVASRPMKLAQASLRRDSGRSCGVGRRSGGGYRLWQTCTPRSPMYTIGSINTTAKGSASRTPRPS